MFKTYYVTKYWETQGIFEYEAEIVPGDGATVYVKGKDPYGLFLTLGKEAFATREEALERVIKLADAKIVALDKKARKIKTAVVKFYNELTDIRRAK